MAFSRASLGGGLLPFFFLMLLLSVAGAENRNSVLASATRGRRSLLATIDCNGQCGRRCQLSSRHNLCMRACGSCCAVCNCVPPGTSGNQEQCPCYNNLTTHGGRKKCP